MPRVPRPPGSVRRSHSHGNGVHLPPSEARYRALVEAVTDYGILLLDPKGVIQTWNAGVEKVHGYTADQIIGQHFSLFYPPDAVARGWPEHELKVAREKGRFEDEGWRVRRDGGRFWANVIITALYDDNGNVTGFSKITRDLSERRREEEMLRESEERFRMLVEGVKEYAIFMLTPEGRIESWNVGAQNINGYTAEEVIGRHFSLFYPPEAITRHWPDHELRMARMTGRFEDEGWRIRKDGSRFWANVVITALYDHKGELRGFGKLTRDLTVRRQIEDLQRNERRMNEFLAMLGHELRNPLSPLQSALDVLELKPDDPKAAAWARSVFVRQVRHLSRLVDDLLDVSRITSGKVSLRFEVVDLARVVDETVDGMRPQIESRRHTLQLYLPDEPVNVRGDPTRLAQIVSNLVANAVKYTPHGGTIRVSVELDGEFAALTVADNGAGIAPELVPRMFDLFVQGERPLDRMEGGFGIGLTLVKRLAELHGGSAAGSSGGPGQGSEFLVRLPLHAPPIAQDDAASATGAAKRRFKVLIVDDNADVAQSIAMLLEIMGHTTEIAGNGVEALSRAPLFMPDMVILDIGLPGMNGYEVARALRAHPLLRHVVLVACTGYGQDEDRRRVQEAGFDHHLVKPAQLSDIEKILEQMTIAAPRNKGPSSPRLDEA